MAKSNRHRILAGILSLVMLLSMLPVQAFTASIRSTLLIYTIQLTDGKDTLQLDDVEITMTDKKDPVRKKTVKTRNGGAVFWGFAEEGGNYILTVKPVVGYEDVDPQEITVNPGDTVAEIMLKELDQVQVSGVVTDEAGEPYEGATVEVSGYVERNAVTDEAGRYTFDAYVGKKNEITVSAKKEDPQYAEIRKEAVYDKETKDADYQLALRTFQIKTTAMENGTITPGKKDVPYGAKESVQIEAGAGYCIDKITVNQEELPDVQGKKTHTVVLENISQDYEIVASFTRMNHKLTFTVGENGEASYGSAAEEKIPGGSVNVEKNFLESTDPAHPTTVTVTAKPAPNYRVSKVVIDEKETVFEDNNFVYVSSQQGGDIAMDRDHTFAVEFAPNRYALRATCGEHGTAVWGKDGAETKVPYGGAAVLDITPERGYGVASVLVNGKPAQLKEDGKGIHLALDHVTQDMNVEVRFENITVAMPENHLKNSYYEITFTKPPVKEPQEVDGMLIVALPSDATATVRPVSPYTAIRCNEDSPYGELSDSVTFSTTTVLKGIYVVGPDQTRKYLTPNVKIIIDRDAPVIQEIPEPEWSKEDTVSISGTVDDGESSGGLNYVVWSRDAKLTPAEVLAATEHKVPIKDGKFTFQSMSGEQNSTYYIYAVDNSNNVSEAREVTVKIDKQAPVITQIMFSTEKDRLNEKGINFASYATVYKETMYLTVTAADPGVSSGLDSISLYCGETLLDTQKVSGNSAVFELTEELFESKKVIYAVATDKVALASKQTKPTQASEKTNARSDLVQITSQQPKAKIDMPEAVHLDESGRKWYGGEVTFQVIANDAFSGVRYVEIWLNGQKLTRDLNNVDLTQDFSANGSQTDQKVFTVSTAQNSRPGKNKIEVIISSAAGQLSERRTEEIYIDTTTAEVENFAITTMDGKPLNGEYLLDSGNFYRDQVQIVVTAKDEKESAGIRDITLFLDGKKFATNPVDEKNQAYFTVPAEKLTENSVFTAEIAAVATDYVNHTTKLPVAPMDVNKAFKSDRVVLENVAPTAQIVPTVSPAGGGHASLSGEDHWYAGNVEFNVTAQDQDSGLRNVRITINDRKVMEKSFLDGGKDAVHSEVFTVNTGAAGIESAADGSYTVVAEVTDLAGNVFTSEPYVIYKDEKAPYIESVTFGTDGYIEGDTFVGDAENSDDFGFYFRQDTSVTITAKDPEPSSGLHAISYYTVDYSNSEAGEKSQEQTLEVDENGQITVTVPANFKGKIFAKATDRVNNTPQDFVNPNGIIVETKEKHDEQAHITLAVPDASHTAADGTPLYSDDVAVDVVVSDTYSGIREIEWSVEAPYDTGSSQSGKVVLRNDMTLTEGSETDWVQTQTQQNLVTRMEKTLWIRNDSNDIVLTVKLTDRAGNVSVETRRLSIDKSEPTIQVVYGEDEVSDSQYPDYFSTGRTATVIVTERNFSASDVAAAITNSLGTVPGVDLSSESAWVTGENSSDPNKTTHTARIEFSADGDYTFSISYTDRAGHPANPVASQSFTVDRTKPEVTVSYNSLTPHNGNYYNADRVATITVKERNFDADRVHIMGTAEQNNAAAAFPAVSSWTDQGGDTHTATIHYTQDGRYTFDVEFTDMAGNVADDYGAEEFYVDQTAPSLSISGVADKSANNGKIAPVISCSDENFHKDGISITLTGVNHGAVEYPGVYEEIPNGKTFAFENFAEEREVDDLYTLTARVTDLAGNESESTITFSANRFGSVYDLSQIQSILNKYLPKEQDIVFTETNVDMLEREEIQLKLTKNGVPADLKEGTDYTVEMTGGDGQWSVYRYTVKKALFADDGKYSLAIYSKDAAGNVNENIDEAKAAEINFGVDKTKPVIVPVDLSSGVQYAVDVKTVSVEIKDNLVLDGVRIFVNGNEVEYKVDGELYTFEIPKSTSKQSVKIVAVDAAGNESPLEIENFLVNANLFVRWYNHTPLFVGSLIAAGLVVTGLTVWIVLARKKKKNSR